MKKYITWFFTGLLVLILGFWIWCQRPGLMLEEVLPSHPLVFVRLAHMQEHVNQVIRSDFGKNLAAIDLPDVLSRNNFSSRDIRDFKHWQKELIKFWENPLIKRFLG